MNNDLYEIQPVDTPLNAPHPPRITLALFAYRQSAYIEEAVRSALSQVSEPIEILLSDDASPDDTFEKMQALAAAYQGPHLVRARRNPKNLGLGEHINEVVREAQGQLIIAMAGDDVSLPHRAARVAATWDASGQGLDLIASHVIDMRADGEDVRQVDVDDLSQWRSVSDWARRRPYVVGAAHAFTKRLFERFGPYPATLATEDQINTFRAIASGGASTIPEPLVRYRRGGMSDGKVSYTAADHVAVTQRRNVQLIAQHELWLADAAAVGCREEVEVATRKDFARHLFLRDVLSAPNAVQRWAALSKPSPLGLGWRLRKLLYWQWPALAAGVRRFQAESRRRRAG